MRELIFCVSLIIAMAPVIESVVLSILREPVSEFITVEDYNTMSKYNCDTMKETLDAGLGKPYNLKVLGELYDYKCLRENPILHDLSTK